MAANALKIPFNGSNFFLSIVDGNMISLNSVYEMVGSPKNQSPYEWSRLPSTIKLIKTITKDNTEKSRIIKSKRGKGGGTIAHWQLALTYAKYLSPELHIAVNNVFKERLEEYIDPDLGIARSQERARKKWKAQGKSDEWISRREESKFIHGIYIDTLLNHDVKPGQEIGQCTNQIYRGLFHKDKAGIEKLIRSNIPGLPKQINIRDHAKLSSLAAISLSEALSSESIDEVNALGVEDCSKISLEKAASVRLSLDDSRNKDNASFPPKKKVVNRDKNKNRKNIQGLREAIKKST